MILDLFIWTHGYKKKWLQEEFEKLMVEPARHLRFEQIVSYLQEGILQKLTFSGFLANISGNNL